LLRLSTATALLKSELALCLGEADIFRWIPPRRFYLHPESLVSRSKSGNQYVLVVVDWFTKYVLVHPMGKATSKAIVKFIENQVFLVFGVCQIFACDIGSQFVSKDFKELMKKYNVQKIWYNAKYHAQVNHTERVNRTIITAIRSYIHENHRTWDQSIHQVAQAIRLAKHEVTGFTPVFLNFGRNVPVDGSFY